MRALSDIAVASATLSWQDRPRGRLGPVSERKAEDHLGALAATLDLKTASKRLGASSHVRHATVATRTGLRNIEAPPVVRDPKLERAIVWAQFDRDVGGPPHAARRC